MDEKLRERVVKVERRRAGDVQPNLRNPKLYSADKRERLNAIVGKSGKAGVLLSYFDDDGVERYFDGNTRSLTYPNEMWWIAQTDLTQREVDNLVTLYDPLAGQIDWDNEILGVLLQESDETEAVLMDMLEEVADEAGLLDALNNDDWLGDGDGDGDEDAESLGANAEPQVSRADELRELYGVERGQVWRIGEHRLMCGDSVNRADVEILMGEEVAVLLHADPPYGMGKEKDGVANDNLYKEKLDTFQMQWWAAFRPNLANNGSAYIWGNAADLWRLWYCGGLRDSERLTYRNMITWDKKNDSGLYDGNGIGSSIARQFAAIAEFCLFFMLGEQGFNNNADNYWEGWDRILTYLQGEAQKAGLTPNKLKEITGVGMYSHWFTKSQWVFIPEHHYRALQDAFEREYDAFEREYDALKRDFYATRAYFDNTHENMTDVWQFSRVKGNERHEHATPKPVAMMERAIKSSSRINDLLIEPFGGSGSTMVAAENVSRRCYMMELSPAYCAVIIQRMKDAFGIEPELVMD